MAVSLEGTFKLFDRASPAIEKIERRAQAADRAVNKLGRSLDRLAAREEIAKVDRLSGTLGKLESKTASVERAMSKTSRTSRSMTSDLDRNSSTTKKLTSDMGKFETLMRKVVITSSGFLKVLAPARFSLILTAIRPLIGVVSALGAGAVALVQSLGSATGAIVPLISRMGDLAGAGAAAATIMLSVKAATLTTKFAMHGVTQAINGSATAMKKLTPEARAFVREMQKLRPVLNTIRGSAQRGLFPGLTGAIQTARQNGAFQAANQAVGGIGSAVGGVAQDVSTRFTAPSALKDTLQQVRTFDFVITHLGRAVINLVDAFRNVLFTAQPLTRWLVSAVQHWSAYLNKQVQIARYSGALGRYFENTRRVLTNLAHTVRDFGAGFINIMRVARGESTKFGSGIASVAKSFRSWTENFGNQARVALWFQRAQDNARAWGHVLMNVLQILTGLGKAAAGLGQTMSGGIEKATRRWAEWVNSFAGQNELNRWFNGMRSTLKQLWGLISDISGAFIRLGQGGGGAASLLERLRTLVPDLEGVLSNFNRNIGPGLFATLQGIFHLVSTLTMAGSSPLGMFLRATAAILQTVNHILDRFHAVRFAAALAVTAIGGALLIRKLAEIAGGVGMIAQMWNRVTGSTIAATEAAGAYGMVSGARAGRPGSPTFIGPTQPTAAESQIIAAERGAAATAAGRGRFGRIMFGRGGSGMGLGLGLPIAAGIGSQLLAGQGVIGQGAANNISTVAGLAGTGAMIGSVVPGLGTGIGAALGAGIGLAGVGFAASSSPSVSSQNLTRLQRTAQGQGFNLAQAGGGAQNLAQQNRYQRILDQNLTQLRGQQKRAPDMFKGQFDKAIAAVQVLRGENIKRLGEERHTLKVQQQQTDEMRKQARIRQSRGIAAGLGASYGQAFNVYRAHGLTVDQATHRTVTHALSRAQTLQPAGARVLMTGVTAWLAEQKKHHPELQKEYDRWNAGMKTTMEKMGVQITTSGSKVLSVTTDQWKKIKTAMQTPLEQALQEMSPKFTQLQNQARAVLIGLGYSPAAANNVIRTMEAGGAGPSAAAAGLAGAGASGASSHAHGGGHARGGRIGGYGLRDTVPIAPGTMAAPGELIVNRHTESKVDRLLRMAGGPSLGGLVGSETRRHDQDILPDAGIFMAKGGRLGAVIREANRIDAMHIPYQWAGSHGTPSNPMGPWDCSSATSRVLQAAGYGNPTMVSGQFENWGLPGPGPIGIAANAGHVYMVINGHAWGTSSSNPGGGPGWISGYTWRPGFVQRHAPGAGGAGGASPFDTGPGGLPLLGPLDYSAMGIGNAFPYAATLRGGHAEAVGLRGSINRNLRTQAAHGPLRNRRALGGRVNWGGWHAGGLDKTFHRPTMIGVGESGSERVTVSKPGSAAHGPQVVVESIVIHQHGPGDVKRELDRAFADLARTLERAPATGGA